MAYNGFKDDKTTYFAARESEATASALLSKAESFFNNLNSNSYTDKLERMWRFYHGAYQESTSGSTHAITFAGEQGELVQLPVNHFRNLAQHIYVMITSNRPVMEARAANTDYKSEAQTYLANGILDYYMREKHLEDALKRACEMSIVMGSGFVKMEWNATAGEVHDVDPETDELVREGEIEFSTLSPFDVIVDGTKDSWDNDWIMCRTFKNRFDLIAKYPELEDALQGIPSKNEDSSYRYSMMSNDQTDDIPVYEFYHKKTEALINGRYMLFCDSDTVLLDMDLPYRDIPIFRIAPGEILGTPYGYSPMFDIYPIQEGINSLYSTIMTNQNASGVQNFFVPRGSDLSVSSLEGGLNIVEGNSKPESLNMTETPAEIFKFLDALIQSAETISGVNSVARGNPEASLKSGTALALVQSMSLQFVSGLQQSYVKLIEDCGTSLINILKDFADTPKIVALVGKHNRSYLKEFTGDQISDVNRVIVDVGNPLGRSIAGRVQMAEQLLQMQAIKSPEQYFQVLNTGRLDSMFEGEMDELFNVKHENEMLMEGGSPLVAPTDRHRLHISEHKSVISNPELRQDARLVALVMDHIQGHMDALRNTDPDLLQLIGEQPLPPIGSNPMGPTPEQGAAAPQAPNTAPLPEVSAAEMLTQPPAGGPVSGGANPVGPGQTAVQPAGLPKPPAPFEDLPVGYLPPEGS